MMNKGCKITIRGTIWFLIKLTCLTLVIVQTGINIRDKFFSGKTVTSTRVNKIEDIPLILNIIVKPGFNDTILCEHGYDSAYYYFSGKLDEEGECSLKATDQIQGGKIKQQNTF
jgi:hypothetical protein